MWRDRVKKNLSTLVLGVSILFGCNATDCNTPNFRQYWDNSYNIRTIVEYSDVKTQKHQYFLLMEGTTFPLTKGVTSYFVTAKHVVHHDKKDLEKLLELDLKKDITIDDVLYTIGPKRSKPDEETEYRLSLVAVDENSDTALLKYTPTMVTESPDKTLADKIAWISQPAKSGRANLGDYVFTIGYPLNLGKNVEDGRISSEQHENDKIGKFFWTTVDVLPGMSGGPVYKCENGKNTVIGFVSGATNTWNKTFIIDIDEAYDLMKEAKKNGKG